MRPRLFALLLLPFVLGTTRAEPPEVNLVMPPVAQPGKETQIRLLGQNFDKNLQLHLPFAANVRLISASSQGAVFAIKPADDTPLSVYPIRVRTAEGFSNLRLLSVSRLGVTLDQEPNDRWHQAKMVTLPAILSGELSHPARDVDTFRFSAKAKERFTFATESRRLGLSPDLLIRLRDGNGRELTSCNNTPGMRADELLDYTFEKDGEYIVEVHNAAFNNTAWTNLYCLKAGPLNYAQSVFPLGGKRGEKVKFRVFDRDGVEHSIEVRLPADPWVDSWRLPLPDFPASMSWPIAVGDGPELFEDELRAKGKGEEAPLLTWPTTVNGRIAKKDEEDHYRLTVRPGECIRVRAEAYQLGSALDGYLMVLDMVGKKLLAKNDDEQGRGNIDPCLDFTVPEGVREVVIVLQDGFRRGGLNFGYRLIIEQGGPDFFLALGKESFRPLDTRERLHDRTDTLSLVVGKEIKCPLTVRRSSKQAPHYRGPVQGYEGPIRLKVHGLPKGVTVKAPDIAAGETEGEVTFVATAEAPKEPFEVVIVGEAKRDDGKLLSHVAERQFFLCEPSNTHLPWDWRSRKLLCVVCPGKEP